MILIWSTHAHERLNERLGSATFAANVRALLHLGRWEVWYEVDPREHPVTHYPRGLMENLLVNAEPGGWALVRRGKDPGLYHVVSVLTQGQYEYNTEHLWSSSPSAARAAFVARQTGAAGPLLHRPFEKLRGTGT